MVGERVLLLLPTRLLNRILEAAGWIWRRLPEHAWNSTASAISSSSVRRSCACAGFVASDTVDDVAAAAVGETGEGAALPLISPPGRWLREAEDEEVPLARIAGGGVACGRTAARAAGETDEAEAFAVAGEKADAAPALQTLQRPMKVSSRLTTSSKKSVQTRMNAW